MIPLINTNENQKQSLITTCEKLFLSFFTPDNIDDYDELDDDTVPIYIRCKVFNKTRPGFTTLYIIEIPNIKWLYDREFILTRSEFESISHIYVYPFIQFNSKKKLIWNRLLLLKTTEVYLCLTDICNKCDTNTLIWYLLMTNLIRNTCSILPNNVLLYIQLFNMPFNLPAHSNMISINSKNLWQLWFIRTWGMKKILKVVRENHAFIESIHKNGTQIFHKFNQASQQACRGSTPNMLFFEKVLKYFPTPYDIVNEDENHTDTVILPEFINEIKYYDGEFFNELKDYCKNTINIQEDELPASYQYPSTSTTAVQKPYIRNNKILEQNITLKYQAFKKHNITRTLLVTRASRTGLYADRKYFLSGKSVMKDELYPLLQYPVYTPLLRDGDATCNYTHLLDVEKLDAPLKNNHLITNYARKFLKEPSDRLFVQYTSCMYEVMVKQNYAYHEQVIDNFPIFAMSFDIDINDKSFISQYYTAPSTGSGIVENKLKLRKQLKSLVIQAFQLLNIPEISDDAGFMLFESLPEANTPISKINKIGLRFIVRSNCYVIANRHVMVNIIKIINFLMNFNKDLPGPCIDSGPYETVGHTLRLPMNCKRANTTGNMTKPLLPIIATNTRCWLPSIGLIHHKHKSLIGKKCYVIYNAPDIQHCNITQSVLPSSITYRMVQNKQIKSNNHNNIAKDYTDQINRIVCPDVLAVLQYKLGMPTIQLSLQAKRRNYSSLYTLATDIIGLCVKKNHIEANKNKCSINSFIKINDNTSEIICNTFQFCFGSDCRSTFLCKHILK